MKIRKEITLEEGVVNKLKELAKVEGRSLSNLIKKILSDYADAKK